MSKTVTRSGVFETNSSSTHSICISKSPVDVKGKTIGFYLGEFGWEKDTVNAADYLYTALVLYDGYNGNNYLDKLKEILDKHGVNYTMQDPDKTKWFYIDHSENLIDFIEDIMSDEDLLLRCIFGDSVVYTGNDNEHHEGYEDTVEQAIPEYTKYNRETKTYDTVINPYHDENKYDYYYKSN